MGQVSKPDSKIFNCLYNIKLKWHHNNFPVDQWTKWSLQGTSRDRTALSCSLRNVKLSPENLAETCPDKSADRSLFFYHWDLSLVCQTVCLSVSHLIMLRCRFHVSSAAMFQDRSVNRWSSRQFRLQLISFPILNPTVSYTEIFSGAEDGV